MMKLNTTYYWIFIFLCVPFLIKAQEAVSQSKADSLFALGKYQMAQLEYERIIYTSQDNNVSTIALIKKSECYKQMEDFDASLRTLKRINYYLLPDSLVFKAHYETALCAYLCHETDLARNQIEIVNHLEYKAYNETVIFLNILILNACSEWEEARKEAHKLIQQLNFPLQKKDSLDKVVDDFYNHPPKIKSEKKASIMSMIIPGLGQMYSGYYTEGIFSIALHVSWGWITYEAFYNKLWFTSYIYGFSILQKFYFGNQKRAEYLAKQHNLNALEKFDREIKEALSGK